MPESSEGIEDGMCNRFISLKAYFVLCCCYTEPDQCAYATENELEFSIQEQNKQAWSDSLRIRNPAMLEEFTNRKQETSVKPWFYRQFIYSAPLWDGTDV